jgi:hypothetical protein
MFVFLPLGWMTDPLTAMRAWYGAHLVLLLVSAVLLWRVFFPRGNAVELLACAVLLVIPQGTLVTLYFAQTTFLALLTLLLFRLQRPSWAAGLWVVLAVLVKPFLVVLALPLLAARAWRPLLGMVAATVGASAAGLLAFGAGSFERYFRSEFVLDKPGWIYDQPTNQSALGLVLRLTRAECEGAGCLSHPLYVLVALAVTALTLPLGFRLARRHEDVALALFLLLALLVYPVSQSFYSVLLVPLLLVALARAGDLPGGAWTVALLAGGVIALTGIDWGAWTAVGYLLLWVVFALLGVRLAEARAAVPTPVPQRR